MLFAVCCLLCLRRLSCVYRVCQASFEDAYRVGQAPPQASAAPPMLQRPISLPQQPMGAAPMGNAWIANFRAQQMALASAGPNPDFAAMYQNVVRGPQPQVWNDEFQRMQQQLAMAQAPPPPPQQQIAPQQPVATANGQQQQEFENAFTEAQAPVSGNG